jgi:hypothetical protein
MSTTAYRILGIALVIAALAYGLSRDKGTTDPLPRDDTTARPHRPAD